MIVKIKRQDKPGDKPYWQKFQVEISGDATVAALLDQLNYEGDPQDVEGNVVRRIRWQCSCMQKACGACAMVINGRPALACDTFIRDIKGNLVLEPLSKFKVVTDLIVDRGIINENLEALYLGEKALYQEKEYEHQYSVAKCLKCGLCLEVCPNYSRGQNFYGALFANETYLAASQSEKERKKPVKVLYKKNFAGGCSKSLACSKVCPMNIPTLASIAKMNR